LLSGYVSVFQAVAVDVGAKSAVTDPPGVYFVGAWIEQVEGNPRAGERIRAA
jgi:hypothetical protein